MLMFTKETSHIASHIDAIESALHGKDIFLNNSSYETGLLGLALFYFYYSSYKQDETYLALAEEYIEKSISCFDLAKFKRVYATDSIDNHLANIGRFLQFCKKHNFIELDLNEYLADLDRTMSALMASKISIADFDFNSGALASGYYFLNRFKNEPAVRHQLTILVTGIQDKATVDAEGDFYWKSPSLYNRVYFGLSHGSALICSFLCNVIELGVERTKAEFILRKALNFILKHERTQEKGLYPLQLHDKVEPKQFALCYGDIGMGYALLRAGTVLQDEALLQAAARVLDDCLTRRYQDHLTLDAGITYGAAGLAATYEKIHSLTQDHRFKEAAHYWYEQIPCYASHNNDYAGFKSRLLDAGPLWQVAFGWGITGVGISLMRYLRPDLPPLDDLLIIA